MILYPAIDLKGGQCVRLLRGDMDKATVFNTDPAAQAREFVKQGAKWLHVVDLDGAVAGKAVNGNAVRTILDVAGKANVSVQLGGGIRDIEMIRHWLETGITRVILGTAAAQNPELLQKACDEYPARIAVGVDARRGLVAIDGWENVTSMEATDIVFRAERAGASAIIFTDIQKDGTLTGPNFAATAQLARLVVTPIIASGGFSSIDDIKRLRDLNNLDPSIGRRINGAILGRALYERKFTLADALAIANG